MKLNEIFQLLDKGCSFFFFFFFFLSPTDSDISDLIRNLESQDIKVELMKQKDYMGAAPHSAAINVTGSKEVAGLLTD